MELVIDEDDRAGETARQTRGRSKRRLDEYNDQYDDRSDDARDKQSDRDDVTSAMAPLTEDDSRKPGDQQAWTSEQRHALTQHVDERARDAIEASTILPEDVAPRQTANAIHGAEGGA